MQFIFGLATMSLIIYGLIHAPLLTIGLLILFK